MIRITKWKLVTYLEIDEEGITKITHKEPVMVQPDDEDDEEDDE